jgi:diguanylate cyclase (GGDEF)-like protein
LVLERVADAVKAAVRTSDSVARWGGEEFVVLLPGADLGSAMQTGERIRSAVAALSLQGVSLPSPVPPTAVGCPSIPVTITIGVARVKSADTIDAAIARADAALYRGKAAGRDCVVADGDAAGLPAATS